MEELTNEQKKEFLFKHCIFSDDTNFYIHRGLMPIIGGVQCILLGVLMEVCAEEKEFTVSKEYLKSWGENKRYTTLYSLEKQEIIELKKSKKEFTIKINYGYLYDFINENIEKGVAIYENSTGLSQIKGNASNA